MSWDDDDARCEAMAERRAIRRAHACQCGSELPGSCPGAQYCPYAEPEDNESEGKFEE